MAKGRIPLFFLKKEQGTERILFIFKRTRNGTNSYILMERANQINNNHNI